MNKKLVCAQCGAVEGEIYRWNKGGRPVRVVVGLYGQLCEWHMQNAYARNSAMTKRVEGRIVKRAELDSKTGQKYMFDDV